MIATSKRAIWRGGTRLIGPALGLAATVLLAAGCAGSVATGGAQAWSNLDQLKSKFERGRTTKGDVLLVFGEPHGVGAFGGFDSVRRRLGAAAGPEQAWYYENVASDIGTGISQRQRLLLVFFNGDLFDGYVWIDNRVKGEWR